MKKAVLCALLIILLHPVMGGSEQSFSELAVAATESSSQDYSPAPKKRPFGVGERLRYQMDFSFIRAGSSEMRIVKVDSTCGEPAYHYRSRVRSTSGVDLFYKVRDVVESWFDLEDLHSHRYERYLNEGNYKSRKFFDYDHETGWVCLSNENGPKGVLPFTPFSHNIISSLYWVRCQRLEAGKDLSVPLHDLDKQYTMRVVVYGRETVTVPAGTFKTWKVEPVIESEGLFKKTGRLWVWLTDDENRIPVLMKSEIPVGTIDGKLCEFRLGKEFRPGVKVPDDPSDSKWDW